MIHCQQIPLILNHDWNPTILALHKLEVISRAAESKSFKSVTTASVGVPRESQTGCIRNVIQGGVPRESQTGCKRNVIQP